jgi:hypothetical protein
VKVEENRSSFGVLILVAIGRGKVRIVDVKSYRRVVMSLVDVGVFGVRKRWVHIGRRTCSGFLQNQSRRDRSVVDTAAGS